MNSWRACCIGTNFCGRRPWNASSSSARIAASPTGRESMRTPRCARLCPKFDHRPEIAQRGSLSSLAARSNSPPAAALSELSTRAIRSSALAAAVVCRPQHGKGSPRASWRKVEAAVEHVAQLVMQRHSDRPNTVAAGPGAASDRAEASRLSRAIFGSACGNACDFTVRQHRRHRICVLRIERFDAVCIAFNPETTERRAGRPSLRSTS